MRTCGREKYGRDRQIVEERQNWTGWGFFSLQSGRNLPAYPGSFPDVRDCILTLDSH